MRIILGIIVAIIAGGLFYLIGTGVGEWYVNLLREQNGVITSSEIIECKYILPVIFALIAAYLAYKLQTNND